MIQGPGGTPSGWLSQPGAAGSAAGCRAGGSFSPSMKSPGRFSSSSRDLLEKLRCFRKPHGVTCAGGNLRIAEHRSEGTWPHARLRDQMWPLGGSWQVTRGQRLPCSQPSAPRVAGMSLGAPGLPSFAQRTGFAPSSLGLCWGCFSACHSS